MDNLTSATIPTNTQMVAMNIPAIPAKTLPLLNDITNALNIPRTVFASDEEIQYAWRDLPREISRIPLNLRNDLLARMCIAVACGLFDGAINYVWNASIMQLRNRIRTFGLNVVGQILEKTFDESVLSELKDSELLSLSLQLNLISEEGFFFLDQCRDIRNKFSAAHPSIGLIDDREFISFLSRCTKYALSITVNPCGVDMNAFILVIKGERFNDIQFNIWIERIKNTHDAQRELLFSMLHGIYCDPKSSQEARLNALTVCTTCCQDFTAKTYSDLLNRHYDYQAKGDTTRHTVSRQFFEKLNLLNLLNDVERHAIISSACKRLMSVHMAYDNFYNEPPFAERLLELSSQSEMPDSVKNEFVFSVVSCYVGNQYGVSNSAIPFYAKMIRSFTPREIVIFLHLPEGNNILNHRMSSYHNCQQRFKQALQLLDSMSIPDSVKIEYNNLIK